MLQNLLQTGSYCYGYVVALTNVGCFIAIRNNSVLILRSDFRVLFNFICSFQRLKIPEVISRKILTLCRHFLLCTSLTLVFLK